MVGRICRGTPLREFTVERLGRLTGLPADAVAEASRAAALLYRSEGSGSHQKAKAANPAPQQVACAVCKTQRVWHSPRDRRTPVCVACVRRRTKAQIAARKGAVFTERRGKLCEALLDRWGSLTKLRLATGIGTSTLHRWSFDPEFHPREASLRRLAEAAQVPYEMLYSRYGPTQEETTRRPPRICQICGCPLGRNHNSWFCSTLARAARTIREDLGRLIVTLAAAAVGLEPDRIAMFVDAPLATVDAWLRDPRRAKTVEEIRARKTGNALLPAVASVLGIGRETLRARISGRARRSGHRRSTPIKYPDAPVQMLEALGVTEDGFVRLGGFKQTAAAFSSAHMKDVRNKKLRWARGKPRAVERGPRFSRCALARDTARMDAEKKSLEDILTRFEKDGITSISTISQVRDYYIRHAHEHPQCRAAIVSIMVNVGRESLRAAARVLRMDQRTVARDLNRRAARAPQLTAF